MLTPVTTKSLVQLGAALMLNEYLAGIEIVPPLPLFSEKLQSRVTSCPAFGSGTSFQDGNGCAKRCAWRRRYCCQKRVSFCIRAMRPAGTLSGKNTWRLLK